MSNRNEAVTKKSETMATIIFPAERAEQIAERAYEIDRSGGMVQNGTGFSGSVLTTYVTQTEPADDDQPAKFETIVTSNYYTETSLRELFSL